MDSGGKSATITTSSRPARRLPTAISSRRPSGSVFHQTGSGRVRATVAAPSASRASATSARRRDAVAVTAAVK